MKFILNKDTLEIEDVEVVKSGSVAYYEVDIEYDDSWNDLVIEAIIVKKNEDVGTSIAVINNKILIDQDLRGTYNIGFVGYKLEGEQKNYQVSTNLKSIYFDKGAGEVETQNLELPTPTEWEIYIAQIQKMIDEIKESEGTGGEGTTDYNVLENKPQINGVELIGNKSLDELNIVNEIKARVKSVQNGRVEYDIGEVIVGGMISETSGVLTTKTDTNLGASEYYIPLYIGENYEVSTANAGFNIYFYDADKNFITAQYVPQTTKKDTVTFTNTEYYYARIGSWVSGGMTQENFDTISFAIIVDGKNLDELVTDIEGVKAETGELENLNTEDKTNLVNAINEVANSTKTDTTLTVAGAAADAKTVGDKIDFLRKYNGWIDTNTGVYIDTSAKTLTFGANSCITYGNQLFNVGNTTHDISSMINGNFVYYDIEAKTLTTTRSSSYVVYLGALWKPNHLADFHMDKRKLFIDGMPVSYIGRYHNKTINCLGDSMTEGVGTTKAYHKWFGQLCGFKTINNYGVGGSCISPKVDEIPTWEEGILSFYERYNDMPSADVITVFGGVNDWCTGRELGNITDTTTDTFYGAMKLLCEGLISKYPTSDIFVFSSPQCDYINRPANDLSGTKWAGNTEGYNRKGYKLQDYANAMSEVCAIYGIPFCSLTNNLFYATSGVLGDNNGTSGEYGSDALHPNAEGHKKIALKMSSVINSGIGSGNVIIENEDSVDLTGYATKEYVDNAIGECEFIPIPTLANVDESFIVKAVDESGKPTEWKMINNNGVSVIGEYVVETDIEESTTITLEGLDGNSSSYYIYISANAKGQAPMFYINGNLVSGGKWWTGSWTGEVQIRILRDYANKQWIVRYRATNTASAVYTLSDESDILQSIGWTSPFSAETTITVYNSLLASIWQQWDY